MNTTRTPALTPFFATKTQERALVVRTGVRAGAGEQTIKARESDRK